LNYEIPKEIDFTQKNLADQSLGIPVIDAERPDIFPHWDGVSSIDSLGNDAQASCLTLDSCTEQAESAPPTGADPLRTADDVPVDGNDSISRQGYAGKDLEPESRDILDDVKDRYHELKSQAQERAREFVDDQADQIVDYSKDFFMGKADPAQKYTGSWQEDITEKLGSEPHVENQTVLGEFLTGFIKDKIESKFDALEEKITNRIFGNDTSSKLEYNFSRRIVLNIFHPDKLIKGVENMFGIVQENLDEDAPAR